MWIQEGARGFVIMRRMNRRRRRWWSQTETESFIHSFSTQKKNTKRKSNFHVNLFSITSVGKFNALPRITTETLKLQRPSK